jgi:putative FmdB family regulatory protein
MPFYEYECADCKFYLEVMQKISEPPLKKCPSCGRSRLKKLVSAPNFRLKGGGWYETDFKSDQEKKRNLAVEKEPEAKPAAEAKSEAKPVEAKASEPKAPEAKPAEPKRKPTSRRITRSKSRPKPTAAARRRKRR